MDPLRLLLEEFDTRILFQSGFSYIMDFHQKMILPTYRWLPAVNDSHMGLNSCETPSLCVCYLEQAHLKSSKVIFFMYESAMSGNLRVFIN